MTRGEKYAFSPPEAEKIRITPILLACVKCDAPRTDFPFFSAAAAFGFRNPEPERLRFAYAYDYLLLP